MKKVLSLVLVIAMVLSSMSFAFAAKFEDVADTDYAEAVDTLFALGVITGYEDGTYRPEKTVTRAEMAKLMVELLGYGDLIAGSKSNFSDTQGHWADQWIALAAGRGIVIGTGDGKFNPDGIVTYDQVLTMLVRGLGYTDNSNELKNMTWPTNFKVKAAELNITKNVDMSSANADRGGVAQAMYNALDQQLVKVNADGDIVKEYRTVGTRTDIPVNLITRVANLKETEIGFEHITPEDKKYAGDKVDLTQYLFQTVEAYFNKNNDEEIVYVGEVISLTYTDDFEELVRGTGTNPDTLEVGDYTFDVYSAQVSYNNVEESFGDFNDNNLEDAKITVVLEDDETRVRTGAEIKGIVVEKASAYVQIEGEYKADATKIDEIFLPVKSSKVDSANLIVKGAVTDLADIEEDDIVAAYAPFDEDPTVEATDKLTLVVTRDTVEGKVTGISGSDYFIDRVKYKLNNGLNIGELDIDDEGTFFLDENGKIIAFEGEDGGTKTYAVVYDDVIEGEFRRTARGYQVTKAPTIRLSTSSDERITYEFDIELDSTGAIKNDDLAELFDVESISVGETGVITWDDDFDLIEFDSTENEYFGILVSYNLNKDAEITKFAEAGRAINVRTNSSAFELASNVVIFDREGRVIDEDDLGSTVVGTAVYQNGKIVALLTDIQAEDGTLYYAYVTKIGRDTDSSGDKIQRLTAYINGSKDENLYTDDEGMVPNTADEVYILELDDDGVVISDAVLATAVTTSAIATKVDVRAGELEIEGDKFYFDQGATVIEIDEEDDVYVRNLNAIKKDVTEFDFYAEGNVIKFIIIR
ncbi:S-layer homology domain-containing protein [Sedimentibacter sp.]|uniref:S-layer homology domain-containing protein n=1 Tax=Sedimentibacter sp. TaxID=1960295 RepID=UPI0028B0E2C4|nr:S-layer homology domain-containing protein [Sedimentibacter sp.]